MSTIGMLIIATIYAVSAVDQFIKGEIGTSIAFAGWSLGQFGMALAVK